MPRALPLKLPVSFLAASLVLWLVACTPQTTPDTLADANFALKAQLTGVYRQEFSGSAWSVVSRPAWLQVSPVAGSGTLNLTVTADRARATPLGADQPQLSGEIQVRWNGGTTDHPQSGTATLTVTADQFQMNGRVVNNVAAQGLDVMTSTPLNAGLPATSRGIIVKYRAASTAISAQQLSTDAAQRSKSTLKAAGLSVRAARKLDAHSALLHVQDTQAALKALRADPAVEYAVPNAVMSAQGLAQPVVAADQYAPLQWPFKLLGYPAVWRDMEGGAYSKAVTVAVIDSGVRFDHPDLAGQMWGRTEGALDVLPHYTDEAGTLDNGDGDGADTDPTDPSTPGRTHGSHGTHVTGIIVARWGENGPAPCAGCSTSGVVGAAYLANVKVLPIRALDVQGQTDVAEIVDSLHYAIGLPVTLDGTAYVNPHPAQVINLSLGGSMTDAEARPLCDAIQEARSAGALVFAASGNNFDNTPFYPANCPAAVAVGSVTLSGGSAPKHAIYSNYYPAVQLSAPGGSGAFVDYSTYNGGTLNGNPFPDDVFSTSWDYVKNQPSYEAMAGTSQATPQVSALAALLLAKGVTTDAETTLQRLVATATDLGKPGRDDYFGYGTINAAAALNAPAISNAFGLRMQNERGLSFQPALDALGRFTAYLGNGTYTVVAGTDSNGNGVYGEAGEATAQRTVGLGTDAPVVSLGTLTPQ